MYLKTPPVWMATPIVVRMEDANLHKKGRAVARPLFNEFTANQSELKPT